MMEHDKHWLTLKCDSPEKFVFDYEPKDLKPLYLFVHPVRLQFFFGDRSISGPRVLRYVLTGNLDTSTQYIKDFFTYISKVISGDKVIFLQGVVEDESLFISLNNGHASKYFKVLPRGKPYQRRLINLSSSFDSYLSSLSAKNRQDCKRTLKKFENMFGGRFSLVRYSSAEEIKTLFLNISEASQRTYQSKNLGLHLNKGSFIEKEFVHGANLGFSNCYILYLDGRPLAWRLGYCYENAYFSHHIGYDPDYKKSNPGVVLQLLTIKDLIENRPDIKQLDMLYGDNEVKKKLSNASRVECNFYLFPKDVIGYVNYLLMWGFDGFIAFISSVLSKLKVKEKLKYFMR